MVFLDDAGLAGWDGRLHLVRKRTGGGLKSYGPEAFGKSAMYLAPALAFEAEPGMGRFAITTTLTEPAAFTVRVFALTDGTGGGLAGSPTEASSKCELGPGRTEVANPLPGSGPRIAILNPAHAGGDPARSRSIVGIEAVSGPATRSADATPRGLPKRPPVADPGARPKRIHVVGISPRTGTTLMAEAMSACFHVDQHSRHEDSVFREFPDSDRITLTKNPGDIQLIRAVLPFNPDLYVICMLRDPRDVIVSVHGARPGKFYTGLKFWKAWLPQWRRIKDHPRFITVRYEELVRDPDRVQADIHRRLPFLTVVAPFSDFHQVAKPSEQSLNALNGLRPVAASSVGSYRAHLGRVRSQVEKHGSIAAELIETGYETDASWEAMLRGVETDDRESDLPEFYTPQARRDYWIKYRAQLRNHRKSHERR